MFVRHLEEKDLVARGFVGSNPINFVPETYLKEQHSEYSGISTMMSVWLVNNIFQYKVITDRESIIDRGTFTKPEQIDNLIEKYFTNDYISYRERQLGRSLTEEEIEDLNNTQSPLEKEFFDISTVTWEESNETV